MISNLINCVKLVVTLILAIYALFKPYDNDENEREYLEMPHLARTFFRCLESSNLLRTYVIESSAISLSIPLLINKQDIPLESMADCIIIKRKLPRKFDTSPKLKKSRANLGNPEVILDNNGPNILSHSRVSSKKIMK